MSETLCLVTAFLDLNRDNWSVFKRSIHQYFNNFKPYLSLNHEMIVFMDELHIEELSKLCVDKENIKIIPINRKWMTENIYAYRQLQRETEIMNSPSFKNLVQHRIHHPECCKPEYNIIQHSKIDFVAHVITNNLSKCEYYAWTDFGYFQNSFRIPKTSLKLQAFDLDRINFQGINPITNTDYDILFTLTNAPERIGGFFYLGNKSNLLKYQELYHEVCREFHAMAIVDDDQHIMLQCVKKSTTLFKIWNLGGWHLVYNHFQK